MSQLYSQYINGELHIEEVNCKSISADWGTPVYVYSKAAIESAYREFTRHWTDRNHLVCYSVKACSNLSILKLLAGLGSGFDVVSGGELLRVMRAGGNPAKTVFSGVGKTEAEIQLALSSGILCFNVESASELSLIERISAQQGLKAPVSIRFNPDVDPKTHPYIATGLKHNKFGVDMSRAIELYLIAKNSPHLSVMGIDCHIGSQITESEPFIQALERMLELASRLKAEGIEVHHLDLGGGQGVRYRDEDQFDMEGWASAVKQVLGKNTCQLIFEPGRFIMANAGWLLTKVLYTKTNEGKNFVVVDAAMNDLIRPALYQAWQQVLPVVSRESTGEIVDFVGPVCESADYLAKDRMISVAEGDLVVIGSAGAYGFSMSSNYNSRNRAAELLIDGNRVSCIRRRESIEDQIRLELPEIDSA